MKQRKTSLSKFWLFLIVASSFSMPAMADCTGLNFIGTTKIEILNKAISNYDQLALEYNQNIKIADTAFSNKTDLNASWGKVIASKNSLIKAGNDTKSALSDLFQFNKNYITMGCMQADVNAVETEYKQSIVRLDSSQQILKQVPADWKVRYQKAIACEKLNELADETDTSGRNWSKKYDKLIDEFKIANQQLTTMSASDPAYAKLKQEAIDLKEQAFPGVVGYPSVLLAIYDATIKLQQAGCITLTPNDLIEYQSQRQVVLKEIRDVQSQMQAIKQVSPSANITPEEKPKTTAIPQLRASPEPTVRAITPPMVDIHLRNRSGGILCLYVARTKQMACDFMPNTLRKIKADAVTAFGGGYWDNAGNYLEMKTCRKILPSNTVVQVTRGLDPDCQATQ